MTVWAVLAGGRGTRYGQPKATAPFGDTTFLGHCLALLEDVLESGDTVAVSVANDWRPDVPAHCEVVPDTVADPGPAHSIGCLARFAAAHDEDLVFIAVDMLGVTARSLRAVRDCARRSAVSGRPSVAVAAADRLHWVFAAVPAPLVPAVAANAESVTAVQVLLQLCPVEAVEVPHNELIDVNTPDLRPD